MHNFNDVTFVSVRVLMIIRNSMRGRIPMSSIITPLIMSSPVYRKLRKEDAASMIRNITWAYLTFEALSVKEYDIPCRYCPGGKPEFIVYDGNIKMCFDIDKEMTRARKTKPPVSPDAPAIEKEPGYVDGVAFWDNVEREILRACFRPIGFAATSFRPSLHEWAPWTMPSLCRTYINTEEDKDALKDEYTDEELAEVSAAELMHFITKVKATIPKDTLREAASTRGIVLDESGRKMTKDDIIKKMQETLMPPGSAAAAEAAQAKAVRRQVKTYGKIMRASGGILFGVCPHGTIVQFKLMMRGESVRDPSDLVQCLHAPAQVSIYDNARSFGTHIQRRIPGRYKNKGMLGTMDNYEAAKLKTYRPTLQSLRSRFGPDARFVATDEFHKSNSPNPDDVLYDTRLLVWPDLTNTQAAEQLNSFFRPTTRFLCMLSPVRFAFALRLLVNICNHERDHFIQRAREATRRRGGA